MSDTTFIQLSTADVPRLRPLWETLRQDYVELAEHLPVYEPDDSWERRAPTYRALLEDPDGFVFALERDGQLVAYAAVRVIATSPVFAWSERAGELETLVVADEDRGTGLGARLLADVRRELASRGVDEVVLHVLATNERAIDFYTREGFRPYLVLLSDRMPASPTAEGVS